LLKGDVGWWYLVDLWARPDSYSVGDFHRAEGELDMPKGKPWTKEAERALIVLFRKGKPVDVITGFLKSKFKMDLTDEAVYMKAKRLGLEVVVSEKNQLTTTTKVPDDLPSIENVMKRLSVALEILEQPGIERREIIRLRSFIQGAKIYKELFEDYVHYRQIETELVELRQKYEELTQRSKDDAAKAAST
jgi:hypothetical protein